MYFLRVYSVQIHVNHLYSSIRAYMHADGNTLAVAAYVNN